MIFFKLFVKLYLTIFILILFSATTIMAPRTLIKPFETLRGLQFWWQPHVGFGWMGDTLGDKFNFYYLVDTMVTDGLLTDINKNKVVEDIVDQIKIWYIK